MLDGKQYFAGYPDEDPARPQVVLRSPKLLATLRALEKELRPYIRDHLETGVDADDSTA
jgi:hypothetical protein